MAFNGPCFIVTACTKCFRNPWHTVRYVTIIMNEVGVIIGVTAIIVMIAAATIVRLVAAPHPRVEWMESLLDSMIGPGSAVRNERLFPSAACLDEALGESLVRHFEQSAISRHVLAALAFRNDGMHEAKVQQVVNARLAQERKRELPTAVVRKVVMILMGANLVTLRQGKLQLTTAGKRLHALLEVRETEVLPSTAFASPSA